MTLIEKHKEMDHLPGHKEWILLEDVCEKVDKLEEVAKHLLSSDGIIIELLKPYIKKEPTYGPMLEDKE